MLSFYLVLLLPLNFSVTSTLGGESEKSAETEKQVHSGIGSGSGTVFLETLEEFCSVFLNIEADDSENCTCEALSKAVGDFLPDECIGDNSTPQGIQNTTINIYHATLERIRASVTTVASVIGILGNSVVLIVSVPKANDLKRFKFLIAALASCDLVFAIIQLIVIIPHFWTSKWIYGLSMCKFLNSLADMGVWTAFGIVAIIAVERYSGIVNPMKDLDQSENSARLIYILLGVNVIVAAAMTFPLPFVYEVQKNTPKCYELWPSSQFSIAFMWVSISIHFLLPSVIIVYCNTACIKTIQQNTISNICIHSHNKILLNQRIKERKRIMTILVCIFLLFIFLVFPNRLVWLVFSHLDINNLSVTEYWALVLVAYIPYPFHVAANPFVYCFFDRTFRKKAWKRIRQVICCK